MGYKILDIKGESINPSHISKYILQLLLWGDSSEYVRYFWCKNKLAEAGYLLFVTSYWLLIRLLVTDSIY